MSESIHSRLYRLGTRSFSLAGRVYLAALATVLAVFLCLVSGYYTQRRLAAITHEVLDERVAAMLATHHFRDSLVDYDSSLFRYLATRDPHDLRMTHQDRLEADSEINRLRVLTGGWLAHSLIRNLHEESANYFNQAGRLLSVTRKNRLPAKPGIISSWSWVQKQGVRRQEVKFISTEGEEHLNRVFDLCNQLMVLNRRQLELAQTEMNQALNESRRIVLATGIAACGLTLLTAVGLTASLIGPLNELLSGVERIERGELDFEIPITAGDEVGRLTQTFNRMARTVKEQRERLLHETITDGLTGAYNQRHFRNILKQEIDRARRSEESLCLFMMDIDHFKICNDSRGHEFGNEIIKKVFQIVRDNLREIDFLARYGGDELAVILPNTPADQAQGLAQRIGSAFLESPPPGLEVLPKGRITLSIGGASFPRDARSAEELIERADKALYAAKESGRDCVRWAA